MSRIIIIEMPDKYQATSREVMQHIRQKYPDAGMLLSSTFRWWQRYRNLTFEIGQLPIFLESDKACELIDLLKNPKSYEERNP